MANGGGVYVHAANECQERLHHGKNGSIHWQRQLRRRTMRCQDAKVEWAGRVAGLREALRRQTWWDGNGGHWREVERRAQREARSRGAAIQCPLRRQVWLGGETA